MRDESRLVAELRAALGGTAILPDDGAGEGLAGVAVPKNYRLALIGDADHVRPHTAGRDRLARRLKSALENLLRIVLDPAGLRIMLGNLLIATTGDAAVGGDHQCSAAGRSLVDGEHVLRRAVRTTSGKEDPFTARCFGHSARGDFRRSGKYSSRNSISALSSGA